MKRRGEEEEERRKEEKGGEETGSKQISPKGMKRWEEEKQKGPLKSRHSFFQW